MLWKLFYDVIKKKMPKINLKKLMTNIAQKGSFTIFYEICSIFLGFMGFEIFSKGVRDFFE